MSQDFALSMDIATTLERALAMIAAQLDAEAGSLWLVESDGREIACHACVGPHPITGLRLPVGEGIVGRSVRDNLCQCVLDVAKDPHFSRTMDAQSGFVTRSILCAPMPLADRAIGAIELINRRGGDGLFSESDAHRLQVLAVFGGARDRERAHGGDAGRARARAPRARAGRGDPARAAAFAAPGALSGVRREHRSAHASPAISTTSCRSRAPASPSASATSRAKGYTQSC